MGRRTLSACAFTTESPREQCSDVGRKRTEPRNPWRLLHFRDAVIRQIREAKFTYGVFNGLVSLSVPKDAREGVTPEEEHVEEQDRQPKRIMLGGAPHPVEALTLKFRRRIGRNTNKARKE